MSTQTHSGSSDLNCPQLPSRQLNIHLQALIFIFALRHHLRIGFQTSSVSLAVLTVKCMVCHASLTSLRSPTAISFPYYCGAKALKIIFSFKKQSIYILLVYECKAILCYFPSLLHTWGTLPSREITKMSRQPFTHVLK